MALNSESMMHGWELKYNCDASSILIDNVAELW